MDYFSLPIGPYKHQPATHFLAQTPLPTYADIDLPLLERCPRLPTPASTPPPPPTPTPNTPPPFFPLTLPSRPTAATSQATAPSTEVRVTTTTRVPATPPPQQRQRPPPPSRRRSESPRSATRATFKRWKKSMHEIWRRCGNTSGACTARRRRG